MANRWARSQRVISIIDGRWTLAVLAELQNGGRHAPTSRTRQLGRTPPRPWRVDTATLYRLTDLGRSLDEPLVALERWVDANWPEIEEARRRWNQRGD